MIPHSRHRAVGKNSGKTNLIERFNCTLRQRVSRLVRKTLSFSKKLENNIGAIWYFIHHYNELCAYLELAFTLYPYLFRTTRFFKSREIAKDWEIRTVTITREVDGWYASILLRAQTGEPIPKKTIQELETVNGVDRGLKKIVAMATGEVVANPQISKRFERCLRIRQRALSRKNIGSNNRTKARQSVARVHQKIRRVRDDFQWKLAKKIAASADVIGFEDLNISGMKARCKPKKDPVTGKYIRNGQNAKAGLNRAISDAAWYSLRLKTEHQANKLGNWVVDVPAHHSSQECSQCHYVSPHNRDGEKFVCENCDHHEDADIDASIVIAQRTKSKLSIATLRVVSPKVMPVPELTGNRQKELSLPLGGEPGNRTRKGESAAFVQLSLFDYLSVESPAIHCSS